MKATEAKLLSLLQKSPQFIIPINQRTYREVPSRSANGKQILVTVSRELTAELGAGFRRLPNPEGWR